MSNKIGFVDNSNGDYAHWNLIALIRHFCGGFGDLGAIGYAGTGDGTITGVEASPTSITETWTLTCTVAAANGGTFSVVGSVSGAKADATVGIAYDNTLIAFTLNDGATDFIVGDAFTIPVTQGTASAAGQAWDVLYWDPITDARSLIMKGKGYSGTEAIYVGFSAYHNIASDYYNIVVYGFTGYVPGNTLATQPGARYSAVPAHNQRIDYWLTMTPQRIAGALKVGTPVYESFYTGKMLPYCPPTQFPYPMVVGGMLAGNATPATRFSDTAHSIPYKGNRSGMAMRNVAGSWLQVEAWPWNNTATLAGSTICVRDTGGNYPLLPVILQDANGIYGELEGIYYISGFNNVVENTLTIGGVTYVVIEDVYRTGFTDFYALRMDA